VALPVDHHVGRLQVTMEHAAVVRGREAGADLAGHLDGPVLRQAPDAPQQRRQILPVQTYSIVRNGGPSASPMS
jgi:hypothetical protein